MSCSHEMKQGAVVTVISNPNGPAGCMLCENTMLRDLLADAVAHICGDTDDERDVLRRVRSALTGSKADG